MRHTGFSDAIDDAKLLLAIPSIRIGEIADTVESYAESMRENRNQVPIVVFDNRPSGPSIAEMRAIARTCRHHSQPCVYVGPEQRADATALLSREFPDRAETISQLLGCHYGGARNLIMLYTAGRRFISVDDDIRPHGLYLPTDSETDYNSVAHGEFVPSHIATQAEQRSQDVVGAFDFALGRRDSSFPLSYVRGGDLLDTSAPDPARDISELSGHHRILTTPGAPSRGSRILRAQTHLTGDIDLEARSMLVHFADAGSESILQGKVPSKWCLRHSRPALLRSNSRLTGAVLGCDNSDGGLYFLPTKFRCEDYAWRLSSIMRHDHACALLPVTQTHYRSPRGRRSLVSEWINEEISWALTTVLRQSAIDCQPWSVSFESCNRALENEAAEIRESAHSLYAQLQKFVNDPRVLVSESAREVCEFQTLVAAKDDRFSKMLFESVRREIDLYNRVAETWPSLMEYVLRNQDSFAAWRVYP